MSTICNEEESVSFIGTCANMLLVHAFGHERHESVRVFDFFEIDCLIFWNFTGKIWFQAQMIWIPLRLTIRVLK